MFEQNKALLMHPGIDFCDTFYFTFLFPVSLLFTLHDNPICFVLELIAIDGNINKTNIYWLQNASDFLIPPPS